MSGQKSLFRQRDQFYSPDFEFMIDRRTVPCTVNADTAHWHDYCEVEYVCAGSGEHFLNDHCHVLSPGSVYLITPMDYHRVVSASGQPLKLYHIQFGCSVMGEEMMQRIIGTQAMNPGGISAYLTGGMRNTVRNSFEQLLNEFEMRSPDGIPMMRSCLERLCILILREAEKGICLNENTAVPDCGEAVNRAVQFIKYNFRAKISLKEVAQHVHLSRNYFGELFCRSLGMPFNDYLRQCRLEYAYRLLVNTHLSISEIAMESGFHTASHFADMFRRKYGASPTEFRRLYHEKGMNQP